MGLGGSTARAQGGVRRQHRMWFRPGACCRALLCHLLSASLKVLDAACQPFCTIPLQQSNTFAMCQAAQPTINFFADREPGGASGSKQEHAGLSLHHINHAAHCLAALNGGHCALTLQKLEMVCRLPQQPHAREQDADGALAAWAPVGLMPGAALAHSTSSARSGIVCSSSSDW